MLKFFSIEIKGNQAFDSLAWLICLKFCMLFCSDMLLMAALDILWSVMADCRDLSWDAFFTACKLPHFNISDTFCSAAVPCEAKESHACCCAYFTLEQ